MKKLIFTAVFLFLSVCMIAQQNKPIQTDQVIVRFRNGVILDDLSKSRLQTGAKEVDKITSSNDVQNIRKLYTGKMSGYQTFVLKFNAGTDISKIVDELTKTEAVLYAEPDFIGQGSGERGVSPNDTYYNRQWGQKNDGTFSASFAIAGADIEME